MRSSPSSSFSGSRRPKPDSSGDEARSGVCREADELPGSPGWKRALDLTCLAITLPVWFPLMLVVACWVKLVSGGPLFFRQERIRYAEGRFVLWKFRSMMVDAETRPHEAHVENLMKADLPMTKLDAIGDSRLIPGGRFLRAAGLDELPQIYNVIRGEMSLVGPRPCTPNEFEVYEPAQRERFNAPPGLTGLWQVNGKNKTTFSEMNAMDIQYVKEKSIWMDLGIIAKTIPAIVGQLIENRRRSRRGGATGNTLEGTGGKTKITN